MKKWLEGLKGLRLEVDLKALQDVLLTLAGMGLAVLITLGLWSWSTAPRTYYVIMTDFKGDVSSVDSCSEVVVGQGVGGYSISYTGFAHVKNYETHLRDVSVHPIVFAPEYQKQCDAE